jgi:hypothetical protein
MATIKISQLPPLTSVNSDSEIPVVQGGITYAGTVEDIVSGARPLGEIKITANGSIGGPINFGYSYSASISQNTNGTNTFVVTGKPSISIDATSSNNGSAFTATQVTYPELEVAQSAGIYNSTTLVSLSMPLIETISNLDIYNNPNLTTLNVPNLRTANYLNFGGLPNLVLDFPLLETAYMQVQGTNNFSGYTETMFPSLRSGGFQWGYGYVPSFTINFPLLTKLLGFGGTSSINMNTIYLPALVDVYYYMYLSNISSLVNLTLGTEGVTKKWGTSDSSTRPQFYCQSASLNQASVDNILIVMASLDGTNGTTYNSNGTIALNGGSNATPSAAGLAARSVLLSRGFTVSLNGV